MAGKGQNVLLVWVVAAFAGVAVPFAAAAEDVENGKAIYSGGAQCAVCHKITAEKQVGPGLAGNAALHTDAWLKKWIADPQKTWEENDAETLEMKKRLKKEKTPATAMKRRKLLSDADICDLVAYLKTL